MLPWILRGLRGGRMTTAYPRRAEDPPTGFQGAIRLRHAEPGANRLAGLCPTGAIEVDEAGAVSVDRGRCILCGACVRAEPHRFGYAEGYETAAAGRDELWETGLVRDHATAATRRSLGEAARVLRRSIHVRHVDTGSDGAEEWEIQALWNPYYDIQRLGFFLTASPRHADILIVTGAVTRPMRAPLERTWQVMPEPKALIAAGTDACSGGLTAATGLTAGGVDRVLPVDVYVPGSPPSPIALLDGLLLAVGQLRAEGVR